ncbi:AraC family transcriptional regulator [Parachryseolinea silvisoli]|jgi:AraC family transcriptional regulator, exoenzyme S synthesis regulatory protein ExsA|uniref:AraC family transcriptional regulator n=1 Tax=Parachryseolinea silvisoli TaxID=2873601 RepID=UPI002265E813|nr:helix-turn-helix domain-containing protein [Parachryseolinea silvisoli]MCD9017598.1 helix-turn-helix domain-containing protein [Parachryseolinea silvisoli]
MDFQTNYITPDIKLACYSDKPFKAEALFDDHMLIWLIAGGAKIIQADETYTFQAGDIFLLPRNQLSSVIIYPRDGQPHKSVAMHLPERRLRKFYEGVTTTLPAVVSQKIRYFEQHPLLKSCFTSLIPYFEVEEQFPENIAALKIQEAISILRIIDPEIDGILANFEEPGKIDLAGFMEKNYMFNMPMQKFSYLTGRSLSTFNRDFKKHYRVTPQRWLTQKRLELAHYQIQEKRRRPVEVYLEVGFEDLSHFSLAFKKQFGYPPTNLVNHSAARS